MGAIPFEIGLRITSWQLPFYMMGVDCLLNPYPLNPYSLNPYPLNPYPISLHPSPHLLTFNPYLLNLYPLPLPPSPHLLTFNPYPLTFRFNAMEAMPFQFALMITSWQLPFYMMGADCLLNPYPLNPYSLNPLHP
jgi:hypothetical protein